MNEVANEVIGGKGSGGGGGGGGVITPQIKTFEIQSNTSITIPHGLTRTPAGINVIDDSGNTIGIGLQVDNSNIYLSVNNINTPNGKITGKIIYL